MLKSTVIAEVVPAAPTTNGVGVVAVSSVPSGRNVMVWVADAPDGRGSAIATSQVVALVWVKVADRVTGIPCWS